MPGAVNRVVRGDGATIMDITDTTATPENVMRGEVFYGADGVRSVGSMNPKLDQEAVYPEYDPSTSYTAGMYCTYDGRIYVCAAATTGDWDNTKWTETSLNDLKADKKDTVLLTTLSRGRKSNTTIGTRSLAFGNNVTASGTDSSAFGSATKASGNYSHAIGSMTNATGNISHAEGNLTQASGEGAHAEGYMTTASAKYAHAEGNYTTASSSAAHAEGAGTTASGEGAHAEGYVTTANHMSQHVFGMYNVSDPSSQPSSQKGNYVEIVGNGTGSSSKSNARALDWSGNEYLKGDLYVGCSSDSTGGNKVVTESAISSMKGAANGIAGLDGSGKVPSSQLPSYVDDVVEYASLSAFPATGETGKIYVALDTDKTYRWSGSAYIEIGGSGTIIDVQMNGTSIVSSGVANILVASTTETQAIINEYGVSA